jgi:DNA-binding CsgD family transcriptional regulator
MFVALGAEQWAARAAHELRATGATNGGGRADASLTAREREVCALVAGGATNREAAAALYLSPRTVEHHLRAAYRKLGVRSRSELSGRWRADRAPADPVASDGLSESEGETERSSITR